MLRLICIDDLEDIRTVRRFLAEIRDGGGESFCNILMVRCGLSTISLTCSLLKRVKKSYLYNHREATAEDGCIHVFIWKHGENTCVNGESDTALEILKNLVLI